MNEIIWNNRFICIDKKSVYRSDLVNLGIIKVGDLITDNNLFLHEDPYVTITPEQRFFIMGVVHSLPSDWKTVIKSSVCKNEIRPIPHTPYIKPNCGSFPISDVTSKQIYDYFSFVKKTSLSDSPTKNIRQIPRRHHLKIDGIENIWVDTQDLLIGVIYNPPNRSQREFLDVFKKVLHSIFV